MKDKVCHKALNTVKWFEKIAAQGDVDAEYGLGYLILEGDVTEESQEEAFKWLA